MALSHSPSIVKDRLVLYLDAANLKSYPGSGTTWRDLSKLGNNGVLTNSPSYSSDNTGIFTFDGVNDYVLLPSQNDAQSPLTGYGSFTGEDISAYTLEIWIKTSQIAGSAIQDAPGLISRDSNDIWANLTLLNGYVYFAHFNGSWQSNLKSSTLVSNNIWHQIVYVNYTNETGSIFVDGVREVTGSSTLSGTNYFSPDNIGRGFSGKYYSGSIGSVKFYDKSLTSSEIVQNFEALRGRYGI